MAQYPACERPLWLTVASRKHAPGPGNDNDPRRCLLCAGHAPGQQLWQQTTDPWGNHRGFQSSAMAQSLVETNSLKCSTHVQRSKCFCSMNELSVCVSGMVFTDVDVHRSPDVFSCGFSVSWDPLLSRSLLFLSSFVFCQSVLCLSVVVCLVSLPVSLSLFVFFAVFFRLSSMSACFSVPQTSFPLQHLTAVSWQQLMKKKNFELIYNYYHVIVAKVSQQKSGEVELVMSTHYSVLSSNTINKYPHFFSQLCVILSV